MVDNTLYTTAACRQLQILLFILFVVSLPHNRLFPHFNFFSSTHTKARTVSTVDTSWDYLYLAIYRLAVTSILNNQKGDIWYLVFQVTSEIWSAPKNLDARFYDESVLPYLRLLLGKIQSVIWVVNEHHKLFFSRPMTRNVFRNSKNCIDSFFISLLV